MTYPTEVAREVAARRPDLASGDAISAVLTSDPSLTATEVIETLDTAAYDAAFELAHDSLSEAMGAVDEQSRKAITDALNNTWVEGITVEVWVRDAARRIGV